MTLWINLLFVILEPPWTWWATLLKRTWLIYLKRVIHIVSFWYRIIASKYLKCFCIYYKSLFFISLYDWKSKLYEFDSNCVFHKYLLKIVFIGYWFYSGMARFSYSILWLVQLVSPIWKKQYQGISFIFNWLFSLWRYQCICITVITFNVQAGRGNKAPSFKYITVSFRIYF